MILKLVKKLGCLVQEILERYVLGGFIQKYIWGWKHLYRKNWDLYGSLITVKV